MKNRNCFDFLQLEFRDLYQAITNLLKEDKIELITEKILKIISEIVIIIHLKNNLFYNSENTLIKNIEYLSRKEILPYSLMKYLVKYIEDIELINTSLINEKINEENIRIKLKELKVIYEFSVWMAINCGEEKYNLFYDKLSAEEKKIFGKYLDFYKEELYQINSQYGIEELEELNKRDEDEELLYDEDLVNGELYYIGKTVEQDYYKAREYFKKSANRGNQYAQSYLGLFYEKGYGGEKDIDKALYWYKKSALQGNAFAQYSLGYTYFTGIEVEKNLDFSFKWYKEAAENGFPPAQYALSYLYKNGFGCEKSIFKAYYWLETSAENDFEDAYYILGQSYLDGIYIDKDYKKAFFYLSKGAEVNDVNCLEALGDMYLEGFEVEKDGERALSYYLQSAEEGNIKAYYKIGRLYEEEENYEMALLYYLKGHNNGDLKSTQRLGIMYYNGEGVNKDTEKAIQYMKKAIVDNDPHSLYLMGVIYLEKDRDRALYYLRRAYKRGSHYAAEVLASEYYIDILNKKKIDEKELLEYINYAADKGLADAIYYKGLAYIYGIGLEKDEEEAFKLFIEAAEKGSEKAMLKLGSSYLHGIYVKQNIANAIKWYKEAIKEKSLEAYLNLIDVYEKGIGIDKDYNSALNLALELRKINKAEGNEKLIYYNAKGIGLESSYEKAEEYLKELFLIDEGKTFNILGELAEENLLNYNKNDAIKYYLEAISRGNNTAYDNLVYYLYKNKIYDEESQNEICSQKDIDYKYIEEKINEYKNKYNFVEMKKATFIEGVKNIEEGRLNSDNEKIETGIKDIIKSIHLGFYEGIKYLVSFYEEEVKTKENLLKLYEYKKYMEFYGI